MSKRLGIIGGSGLYEIPGVDILELHSIDTACGVLYDLFVECCF